MKYAEKSPALWDAIHQEEKRQQNTIELIASENIVSDAVREAQGSVLTNKYAEGYPGRRYYGGCQYIDKVEQLAIDYAKNYSMRSLLTFNLILVRKRIWQFIRHF